MFVKVRELPQSIQAALKARSFHKQDVKIETAVAVSPIEYGTAGSRGYLDVIDLTTGKIVKSLQGSYGGSNMNNPNNQVDLDDSEYPIPVNACVIKGTTGHHNYATVYLQPANTAQLLPAPAADLTELDRRIVSIHLSIKGGHRNEYLDRAGATRADVESLAARGYLKINKAGAVSVTTQGKNIERTPSCYI